MTIKDIANLSGYGIGTVSRVINNQEGVSEKARTAIMKIVEQNHFQPNSNARHLKMQASSSMIIIVKGTQNFLFSDILEQMQKLFLTHGENVSVSYIDEDANEVSRAMKVCREKNPKGIIFLGGNLEYFKADFEKIKVPGLLVTNSGKELEFDNLSSLTVSDESASAEVVKFLVEKGHHNIGILGGNLSSTQISYRRYSGCKKAFEELGIPFTPDMQYEPCRFSMDAGYLAAKKLIEKNLGITAIFAMSDLIAIGAIRAIYDMGKRVPEDISVVGYDGILLSQYCVPRLTTIYQDAKQFAAKGVDVMLQRIHYSYEAVHEIIPYHLVEGESVQNNK